MAVARNLQWILAAVLAITAGYLDGRFRRIPNWLTVPSTVIGVVVGFWIAGWAGAVNSLYGAGLGLLLLLPFVLLRALGAGDWKLVGALGALLGPQHLVVVLMATIIVAGVMALALVMWKGRLRQTLRNILRIFGALFSFHVPAPELSLDNPESLKVPFGVAVAIAVILYAVAHVRGVA